MLVKITRRNYWYDNPKAIGKLVEVKDAGYGNYFLIIGEHNDKLFSELDNIPYKGGRAEGCNYKGCWVDSHDCEKHVEVNNNREGKFLLESEY